MASIKNALMLSCKKATELIEKKDLVGLDPIQNMQLSVHLMLCKACKDYEKQSHLMDKMVSMHMKKNTPTIDKKDDADPDLKEMIIDHIRNHAKDWP
jgi:hypothetical protein